MPLSVIIAAAGLGKRLFTETTEIAKPLVYHKNKPIIAHLIDEYRTLSDNIIVVVSSDDKGKLLASWLIDYYKSPQWLNIIEQGTPSGTNDATTKALSFVGDNDECLVSWADFVIPQDTTTHILLGNKNDKLFFTANMECRFGLENNRIIEKQSNPGFLGLYYFRHKPQLDTTHNDLIENFIGQSVKTANIDAISLGTIKDLINAQSFQKQSNRFFNDVQITNDQVIKTAYNDQSIGLQDKETNWYVNASDSLQQYLPGYKTDKNRLILNKIIGTSLQDAKLDKDFWRHKLPKLIEALHTDHQSVNQQSCIDTYILKPQNRLNEVKNTIDAWFGKSKVINGIDFSDWAISQPPKDLYPEYFTFIHGDLQFSNTMIDNDGHIKMFDPRGYFGKTLLYGDPSYDIAKLAYGAIDNYHLINSGKFALHKLNNNNTIFVHQTNSISTDMDYFFTWARERYDISKEKLNFLIVGIWLSLTSYIIDSPLAIIASYCQAMSRSHNPIF